MKEKYYIVLEEYERRMIINSLNECRKSRKDRIKR